MDTKSQDKKQTLLHYIVRTVSEKFPDVFNFDSELIFVDKASQGMPFFRAFKNLNKVVATGKNI